MIGGVGPESTVDYYHRIVKAFRNHDAGNGDPHLIINSLDLKRVLACVNEDRLGELSEYVLAGIQSLAAAGSDFAVISSNTVHIVYNEVASQSVLPMISIIEATLRKIKNLELKRLGVFGTRYTMQGKFFHDVFRDTGIELIFPDSMEQNYIHEKYLSEFVNGVIIEQTREALIKIARRMADQNGIEGLILGGTELPLILNQSNIPELKILDTSEIHVEEIVEAMFQ